MKKLISPNLTCRKLGCQDTVPSYGGYPGLPQSHCCRCGMKTGYADPILDLPDFEKPTYPYTRLCDSMAEWFRKLFKNEKIV